MTIREPNLTRSPQQIARRALILGAISFRYALEVTDNPRAGKLSQSLLPWLCKLECDNEIDPIEQDLLSTPLGRLGDSLMIDARWAGENAAYFCWTLKILGPLEVTRPDDQSRLPVALSILRPEAAEILRSASIRKEAEIRDVCTQILLIKSILRESRVPPPASEIIRRLTLREMAGIGLAPTGAAVKLASKTVVAMTPEVRQSAAGIYFVRSTAAQRLFSSSPTYFE